MGNVVKKYNKKLLTHPHLNEQISQAFEHGNPLLLYHMTSDTDVRQVLLERFSVVSPIPPKHGYMYMGIRNIVKVRGTKLGSVLGASLSWFLRDHPTAIYAYFSAAVLNNPNTDESFRQQALSYRTDLSDKMVGEKIIDLIKHGEMSVTEMTKAYPVKFPERLTDDLTDDQLLWLLLAGENPVGMEMSDLQRPRLLAALVKADLYACHDWLTPEDLTIMLPNILARWHYLRNVASNYFMEVVAPYYLPLFQFLFNHNFLSKITQQDANLLTMVYPKLLGDEPEKWSEGPDYHRSVKCLSYHTLYHMLGGDIRSEFFHPTNERAWREDLIEMLDEDSPPAQDIGSSGYYGNMFRDIEDGNSTDLTDLPISEYNMADVVVIYDADLTKQYYITRTELYEIMKTKINPYNREIIPDQQLLPYQQYLNWHHNNIMPVTFWAYQWDILKRGNMIQPSPEQFDNLINHYAANGEVADDGTITADTVHAFIEHSDKIKKMDRKEIVDIITQANRRVDLIYSDDEPMADDLKSIMGTITQIVERTDGTDVKKIGELSTNPHIKQIEN